MVLSKTDKALLDSLEFMQKMLRYQLYAIFGLLALVLLIYGFLFHTPMGRPIKEWIEKKRQENIDRLRREGKHTGPFI